MEQISYTHFNVTQTCGPTETAYVILLCLLSDMPIKYNSSSVIEESITLPFLTRCEKLTRKKRAPAR